MKALALALVALFLLPTVCAKPTDEPEKRCTRERALLALDVGRPRCDGEARGWICAGKSGVNVWTRGGLFLVLTTGSCGPRAK